MTQNNIDKTKIHFRDALPSDFKMVLNLWQRTFNKHSQEMEVLLDLLDADKKQEVNNLRLMEYQGKIIGCVKTENRLLQFGQAKLKCGDVGYVAIDPSVQGQGLGHLLMEDNSHFLEERGYDIGRLGGLVDFYSRFGWSRFPTYSWRFGLEDVSGGVKKIPFEKVVAIDFKVRQKIRPMVKNDDWVQYQEACKECHEQTFWYLSSNSTRRQMDLYRKNDVELERWVYEENGCILACLELYDNKQIVDVGWRDHYLREFIELLKFVLGTIKKSFPTEKYATVSLPWDLKLIKEINTVGLQFELVKRHGGISSNMIKIVNLNQLMNNYLPELKWRSETFKNSSIKTVTFKVGDCDQQIVVDFANYRISNEILKPSDVTYQMSQANFLAMLMGTISAHQVDIVSCPSDTNSLILLNTLFPLQIICGP